MKSWNFTNPKNPIWFIFGLIVIFAVISVTTFSMMCGSDPISSIGDIDGSVEFVTSGRSGIVTESSKRGPLVLSYRSITGSKDDLQLKEVKGQLRESETVWDMSFPCAKKSGETWTFFGPLDFNSTKINGNAAIGKGCISDGGPALRLDQGIWYGLSPMTWYDLSGQGKWILPAGWYRDLNGKFIVENGPVRWLPNKGSHPLNMNANKDIHLLNMDANRMRINKDFQEGHMEDVTVNLVGGKVKVESVDIYKTYINWLGPVSFVMNDGWCGSSTGGLTPRSSGKNGIEKKVELKEFQANRGIDGRESIKADCAIWTKVGLRLDGNVCMEQPLDSKRIDSKRILLRANKILQRNRSGLDGNFPIKMPVGEIWAGPQAVLSWDDGKSLISSHHMAFNKKTRQWLISSPAHGRLAGAAFTAGKGQGDLISWSFDGPVLLTRFRERLAGRRLVMHNKALEFPDGIVGTLAAAYKDISIKTDRGKISRTLDEDISIKADRGKSSRTFINLDGRAECSGSNWRLQADSISVTLNAENKVNKIDGIGAVFLVGQMGEGRGDSISIDLSKKTVDWLGKVKTIVGADL